MAPVIPERIGLLSVDYKKLPNEVGGMETALPEEVADRMKKLLSEYNNKEEKAFEDILDFHVKFELYPSISGWQWSCGTIDYVQGMPEIQYCSIHYRG